MHTFQHVLSNIQTKTPPPKHMTARGYMGTRDSINLDKLAEACEKRGADVHDVIAMALTEEARDRASETGMNLKAQSDLAWRVVDKSAASKKAIEHSGNAGLTVVLQSDDADL